MRTARGALRSGLAALAGVGSLCLTPAAIAGDVDLGTSGGVTYVQDDSADTAAGNAGFAEAYCPLDKELAGSGEWTTPGLIPQYHLTSISPSDGLDLDGRNDDAALIGVYNDTSTTAVVGSAYAICLDGKFRYRSSSATVITGFESSTATVRCPRRTHVTGGGAVLDAAVADAYLHSSYPIDSSDKGRKPDDGWRARAYATGTQRTLTVHAYCWNKMPRYKRYEDVPMNAGETFGFPRPCQRHLLSGGVSIPGNASEARVLGLAHPFDDLDDGDVPGDGIDVAVTNSTGSPKEPKIWAICKR